jgi:hypothetical protein
MMKLRWQRAKILVGPRRGEEILVSAAGHVITDREGNRCLYTNLRRPGRRGSIFVVLDDVELMRDGAPAGAPFVECSEIPKLFLIFGKKKERSDELEHLAAGR